ncbi:MAG: amidohydrolase family protein [Verrucomicrobiia bacterium]|jgi:predicted TIM-barrel fold metal-dependent hydrolase
MPLIDTNVHLHRWPFRRLKLDAVDPLVSRLKRLGVSEAWAGSYDALLHRDVAAVNSRLVWDCERHPMLRAIGTVNPSLPDWEEDLRRCAEDHRMPGIRLYPNFHGYELSDPKFERLLREASQRRMFVQIAVMMEEERTQHPLVQLPHVNTAPLPALLKRIPDARVMLQNCFRSVRGGLLLQLLATKRVWFDISTVEGMAGIKRMLTTIPDSRLVFGTHAPLYIPESALLKLQESELTDAQLEAIRYTSAASVAHR